MKKMDTVKYECPQLKIEEMELTTGFLSTSDFGVGVDKAKEYYGDESDAYSGDLYLDYYN